MAKKCLAQKAYDRQLYNGRHPRSGRLDSISAVKRMLVHFYSTKLLVWVYSDGSMSTRNFRFFCVTPSKHGQAQTIVNLLAKATRVPKTKAASAGR